MNFRSGFFAVCVLVLSSVSSAAYREVVSESFNKSALSGSGVVRVIDIDSFIVRAVSPCVRNGNSFVFSTRLLRKGLQFRALVSSGATNLQRSSMSKVAGSETPINDEVVELGGKYFTNGGSSRGTFLSAEWCEDARNAALQQMALAGQSCK